MWADTETDVDYINFNGLAESLVECVMSTGDRPVCIGVSGAWGTGKSSMLKLTRAAIISDEKNVDKYIFVEFNAWLFQGFDDARASLMETIAEAISKQVSADETLSKKASALIRRMNWFRVAKLTAGAAASVALGIPLIGPIGDILTHAQSAMTDGASKENVDGAIKAGSEVAEGILHEKIESPPQEIHKIRTAFENLLEQSGRRLVVFIDDLDRCLPETAISTLEAIRLFMFVKHTSFIVAADTDMIKDAVRKHFDGMGEKYVTNYFDKLIQISIPVPSLGPVESKAYMMNLFAESSSLNSSIKESIRQHIKKSLEDSWKGSRLTPDDIAKQVPGLPPELLNNFRIAEQLAFVMSNQSAIDGNPRLIKRLLNTISLRQSIARRHAIPVREEILAKMLLLERWASNSFSATCRESANAPNGRSASIGFMESGEHDKCASGATDWKTDFMVRWSAMQPALAEVDLRPYVHLSKDRAIPIMGSIPLSGEASDILDAILTSPTDSKAMTARLRALSNSDFSMIADAVLHKFEDIPEWGANGELEALVILAGLNELVSIKVIGFFQGRPGGSLKAGLVPKLIQNQWGKILLAKIKEKNDISAPLRAAISKAGI